MFSKLVRRAKFQTKQIAQNFGYSKLIPIDRLLMGGENDISGWKFAFMSNDFLRPSTRVANSPHTQLLLDYENFGSSILESPRFEQTAYFKNALLAIDLFGAYFPGIDSAEKIRLSAEYFINNFIGKPTGHIESRGHSKPGSKILVKKIQNSDCYQLIQGNHRAAYAILNGKQKINVKVLVGQGKEITPIQFLLNSLRWEEGSKYLYQPLPAPELDQQWQEIRKSTDRFEKIHDFLKNHFDGQLSEKTSLDVGSYFGWFVNSFNQLGFDAHGVEKDFVAIDVMNVAYPDVQGKVIREDAVRYLSALEQPFNVVSCLSVLHHFVTQREGKSAEELLGLLDRACSEVLFFEMGEEHEEWFAEDLAGWDADHIENWVLSNSSFTHSVRLGRDNDNIGDFANNYGRMLFAFYK